MSTNFVNQMPYLRTSRTFPEDDIHQLCVEINKSYIDIASSVNNRTIGIFPTTRPAITGNSYFITGNQRQQEIRQVYQFTSTADIPLGFKISSIGQFTPSYGVFTDGTNTYGLIFGSSVAIVGQISFFVLLTASTTTDSIRFATGAGAPTLTSGTIVLSWLSQP